REPAAAAAGALRERVPRVRHRVPLRGEWRAGGRMRTRTGVAVLVLALGRASLAGAVVTGQIFGPGSESFPIAVVPLKNLGGDPPRLAQKTADAILEFLTGERGPFDSAIALVSTRGGRLKDIYRFTFDQDEPVKMTDERSLVVNPRWRPDARAILFTSYRQHFPHLSQVEVASRQVSRVVPGPGVVLDGAWSPDGSKLLVTREEGGNSNIYLLDRGGQLLQRLTDHWAID